MAMLRMPYNNAMRLGQGVNSFTQQLCMIDAVKKSTQALVPEDDEGDDIGPPLGISQIVSYSSRFVNKVSDVLTLSIKTGGVKGGASGKYIDTDKFQDSNLNFFIQVKVTNQEHMDADYTQFQHLDMIDPSRFTDIYGDTFISGWEEGGEFNALISVRLHDESKATHMAGEIEASLGKGLIEGKASGDLNKSLGNSSAETTITVNWCGGGQIKTVDTLWTIDSMTKAAANFPDLVAMTPQRKYAILTKYTMLPSYLRLGTNFSPLDYDNAGIYSSYLLELYTEYKALWKNLQVLSEEYQAGFRNAELREAVLSSDVKKYLENFELDAKTTAETDNQQQVLEVQRRIRAALVERHNKNQGKLVSGENTVANSNLNLNLELKDSSDPVFAQVAVLTEQELNRTKPFRPALPHYAVYPATILGIQEAQRACRLEMVKIVNEVDLVTKDPSIALDAHRKATFVTAAVFKQLVPYKEIIKFYSGNLALLPENAQKRLAFHSDKIEFYRISAPWTQYGESTAPEDPFFFNDLDALAEDDIAFATGVTYDQDSKIVAAVTTYYTSGRAFHHGLRNEASTRGQQFGWNKDGTDLTQSIRSITIEGHRQLSTSRSVVDKIVLQTSDWTPKIYEASDRSLERVQSILLSSPSSQWDFRGWWGYISDTAGFTHLGPVWGLTRPVIRPLVSPYGPGVLDTMPAALRKFITDGVGQANGVGRYYSFSKCIGTASDHVTPTATHFASYFGQGWTNRGSHPDRISFYTKDKAMRGIWPYHPTGLSMVYPESVRNTQSIGLDIKSWHADIDQVILSTQKKSSGQDVLVSVELKGGPGGQGHPVSVADADPGSQGRNTVTFSRPQVGSGEAWLLGGFYGSIGDSIENIGVVWVNRLAYRL